MARTHVSIRGSRDLRARLDQLGPDTRQAQLAAMREWGNMVRDDARDRVPVDTGYLRDHVESRADSDNVRVGVWDTRAYYAQWVEQGSSRQEAQPFLMPAFEANKDEFDRLLARRVERELE